MLVDYAEIAADQAADEELQELIANPALEMKKVSFPGTDVTLYADASTGTIRPYIPHQHRYRLFGKFHNLSHPGIRASQHLLTTRFVWTGINKDVRQWTRHCVKF